MDTLTVQILGVAIAAYSAGLATYKPISEWYGSKNRRLEVVAKISDRASHIVDFQEIVETEDGGEKYYFEFVDPFEENVKLIVTNVSKRTIVLHSYGISINTQRNGYFYDYKTWDINKVLKAKDSKTIYIPITEILNNLKLVEATDDESKYMLFVIDEKNKKFICDFDFNYGYWYDLGEKYNILKDYYEKSPEKFSEGLSQSIHMMADEIEKTGELSSLGIYKDGHKS